MTGWGCWAGTFTTAPALLWVRAALGMEGKTPAAPAHVGLSTAKLIAAMVLCMRGFWDQEGMALLVGAAVQAAELGQWDVDVSRQWDLGCGQEWAAGASSSLWAAGVV